MNRITYLAKDKTSKTFSRVAAEELRKRIGNHNKLASYPSWEEVAKNTGIGDYSVIAFYNPHIGVMLHHIDLARKYGLSLTEERIIVPIILCAGAYPCSTNNTCVYSYKDALGQCRKFVSSRKLIEICVDSTDAGVEAVRKLKSGIAIARKEAIIDGGLEIIVEDMSDKKPNFTEFVAVKNIRIS